jgi:uncharacterized repeat protein (TIGR03847 family)
LIDLGLVDAVDAQAIGAPGQRTFRVRARAGQNRASLWLEKESLATLGRAISQLLADRSQERGRRTEGAPTVEDFEEGDIEIGVARLGIDFREDPERVVLVADDREDLERGNVPSFRMEITRAMALALVESIPEIVGAGRPLCPLCQRPLEDGVEHFCPRTNGHSKELELPSDRLEER